VAIPVVLPIGADIAQLEVFAQESTGQRRSYLITHDALLHASSSMVTFQVNGFTEFQAGISSAVTSAPDAGDGGSDGGMDAGDAGDGGDDGGMDAGDTGDAGDAGDAGDGGDAGDDGGPATTCTIGATVYASRVVNPSDRTQCCNPVANASGWSSFFVQGPTYPLSSIADFVIGDLNGDGWPDMIVSTNGNLSLFLNGGDGGFVTPSGAFYTGSVTAFALADMNKDGFPDLIVGLQGINDAGATIDQVGVLLNDGDGGFGTETDFTATTHVQRFQTGDFNGDGWVDVLAAEGSPYGAGIFLNDGLGDGLGGTETFIDADFTDGGLSDAGSMGGAAVGDFNGDGQLDFALNDNVNGGATWIYLNDGGGTFQSPILNTVIGLPWATAVGKLGNGMVDDLIVTGWSQNDSVVIGQDLGGLTSGTTYSPGSVNAGVADFDGDGNQDFAIDDANGNLWIYFNQGGGTFYSPAELVTGPPIQGFSIADFNGDGAPDLALTTYSSSPTLTIWYAGCGNH
jgi:hypothetical protein